MLIPCVLCGLGIEDPEGGQVIIQEYEQGDGMREHLVEHHSKYVARALLKPNPEDKVHFWLLTNVNSCSDNSNGSCDSDVKLKNRAATGNGFLDSLISSMNGRDDLEEETCHSNPGDGGLTTTSNPAPDDELTSNFLSSLGQLLGTTLKEEGSPQPSGNLVESKAIRKTFCQVCNIAICSTARQRHVYMFHLKRKDVFKCSKCDYTNNNSLWEMRKHCTSHHGGDPEPIDEMMINNEPLYSSEIQKWNRLCFPEWRQKQANANVNANVASKPDESNVEDEQQGTEEVFDEEALKSCVETFIQKLKSIQPKFDGANDESGVEDELSNTIGTPADDIGLMEAANEGNSNSLKQSDWLCHLCWEESRYPGRHIAQKHLGKPLYECPLCEEFAGSYESCTVMKHIRKVHPRAFDGNDAIQIKPISNLERYMDEIRELQVQCFPNRPMKLARPSAANSRPRERHLCRLCDCQVAQSDRQRHVYHKHLRKEKIFQCPLCDFHSNYDVHRVKWHLKWIHKDEGGTMEPISTEGKYREEIDELNEKCFPDWMHRKRPVPSAMECEAEKHEDPANQGSSGANFNEPNKQTNTTMPISEREPEEKRRRVTNVHAVANELMCQLCEKEFKPSSNFLRHVAKEHLKIFLYQCPICTTHGGQDAYDVRAHMLRVHGHQASKGKEPLSNFETNYEEISEVYKQCFPTRKLKSLAASTSGDTLPTCDSSHKRDAPNGRDEISEAKLQLDDQKVACKECHMEMKSEDRQVHVYRHHLKEPKLYECPLCDFAHHACSSDVKNHIRLQHRDSPDSMPKANLIQFSSAIAEWNERCFPGWINRRLPASVLEDFNRCRLCDAEVRQLSRHIAEVHLMIPLHKCPLCEYGAAEARLVNRHMKNNHRKKDIKLVSPFHEVFYPGVCRSPRYFFQALWFDLGCKFCSYFSTFNRHAVESHIQERHSAQNMKNGVQSHLDKFTAELKKLSKACFNDSNISESAQW